MLGSGSGRSGRVQKAELILSKIDQVAAAAAPPPGQKMSRETLHTNTQNNCWFANFCTNFEVNLTATATN